MHDSFTQPPRPSTRLLPEILDYIFDLYDPEDSPQDLLAILSCCLVCKDWHVAAYPYIVSESDSVLLKLDSFTESNIITLVNLLTQFNLLRLPHPSNIEVVISEIENLLLGAPILLLFQTISVKSLLFAGPQEPPHIQSRPITSDPDLGRFLMDLSVYCNQLTSLDISDPALSYPQMKVPWMAIIERAAPQLEELTLSGTRLDDDDLLPLSRCKRLKGLNVVGSSHTSSLFASVVEYFPHLSSVVFGNFSFDPTARYDTYNVILSLAMSCPQLEEVAIVNWGHSRYQDASAPVASIAHLFSRCRLITALNIQHSAAVNDTLFYLLATSVPALKLLSLVGSTKLTALPITDPTVLYTLAQKRRWVYSSDADPDASEEALTKINWPVLITLYLARCPRISSTLVPRICAECLALEELSLPDHIESDPAVRDQLDAAGFDPFEDNSWKRFVN